MIGMEVQKDRIVETLRDLVRIPSHESMREISGYVTSEIRKLGIEPDVDSDGNVIATIGSGQALLLNAHMDTVGVKNYSNALSGEIKDDKLYGRGSSDCKAGVAAMLEIFRVLKENPPRKQVIFAFTVWEETGDSERDGAYKVAKNIKATHGIVLESSVHEDSNIRADIGCKGRFVYNIDVIGRATHSGRPKKGKNAIYLASGLIEKLRGFSTQTRDFPGLGKFQSFLNVTQIEANEGSNTIPGKCSLTVDYRALPGEKETDIRKRIEEACRDVLGKSYVITPSEAKEGFIQDNPEYIRLFKKGVDDAGMGFSKNLSSGWFDGAVFNEAGIITLNLGPGTKGQAHQNPEYCWIPGLVKGTQAVLNVIRRWDTQGI